MKKDEINQLQPSSNVSGRDLYKTELSNKYNKNRNLMNKTSFKSGLNQKVLKKSSFSYASPRDNTTQQNLGAENIANTKVLSSTLNFSKNTKEKIFNNDSIYNNKADLVSHKRFVSIKSNNNNYRNLDVKLSPNNTRTYDLHNNISTALQTTSIYHNIEEKDLSKFDCHNKAKTSSRVYKNKDYRLNSMLQHTKSDPLISHTQKKSNFSDIKTPYKETSQPKYDEGTNNLKRFHNACSLISKADKRDKVLLSKQENELETQQIYRQLSNRIQENEESDVNDLQGVLNLVSKKMILPNKFDIINDPSKNVNSQSNDWFGISFHKNTHKKIPDLDSPRKAFKRKSFTKHKRNNTEDEKEKHLGLLNQNKSDTFNHSSRINISKSPEFMINPRICNVESIKLKEPAMDIGSNFCRAKNFMLSNKTTIEKNSCKNFTRRSIFTHQMNLKFIDTNLSKTNFEGRVSTNSNKGSTLLKKREFGEISSNFSSRLNSPGKTESIRTQQTARRRSGYAEIVEVNGNACAKSSQFRKQNYSRADKKSRKDDFVDSSSKSSIEDTNKQGYPKPYPSQKKIDSSRYKKSITEGSSKSINQAKPKCLDLLLQDINLDSETNPIKKNNVIRNNNTQKGFSNELFKKNQFETNHNEDGHWQVMRKKDIPKENICTFGNSNRKDLYSDEKGNIMQRNTVFGQKYGETSATNFHSEEQQKFIEEIREYKKKHESSNTRRFQLNENFNTFRHKLQEGMLSNETNQIINSNNCSDTFIKSRENFTSRTKRKNVNDFKSKTSRHENIPNYEIFKSKRSGGSDSENQLYTGVNSQNKLKPVNNEDFSERNIPNNSAYIDRGFFKKDNCSIDNVKNSMINITKRKQDNIKTLNLGSAENNNSEKLKEKNLLESVQLEKPLENEKSIENPIQNFSSNKINTGSPLVFEPKEKKRRQMIVDYTPEIDSLQNHKNVLDYIKENFKDRISFKKRLFKNTDITSNKGFTNEKDVQLHEDEQEIELLTEYYRKNKHIYEDKLYQNDKNNFDSKEWTNFFIQNKLQTESTNFSENFCDIIDRSRIKTEGDKRNLHGEKNTSFNERQNTFFSRNFGENLEVYRKQEKVQNVDKECNSKVIYPNRLVLNKYKERLRSDPLGGEDFASEDKYKYPKSWDSCKFCFENATESCYRCITNNSELKSEESEESKDTIPNSFPETYDGSESEKEKENQGIKGLTKWDIPDKILRFCFNSNSIKFFEKIKYFNPPWMGTLENYNKLISLVNSNKTEPLLTKSITESRLNSVNAPDYIKHSDLYAKLNWIRCYQGEIDYDKTASNVEIMTVDSLSKFMFNACKKVSDTDSPIKFKKMQSMSRSPAKIKVLDNEDLEICIEEIKPKVYKTNKYNDFEKINKKIISKTNEFNLYNGEDILFYNSKERKKEHKNNFFGLKPNIVYEDEALWMLHNLSQEDYCYHTPELFDLKSIEIPHTRISRNNVKKNEKKAFNSRMIVNHDTLLEDKIHNNSPGKQQEESPIGKLTKFVFTKHTESKLNTRVCNNSQVLNQDIITQNIESSRNLIDPRTNSKIEKDKVESSLQVGNAILCLVKRYDIDAVRREAKEIEEANMARGYSGYGNDKKNGIRKTATTQINFLLKLRELNITVDEWLANVVIPDRPYQIKRSLQFFVQIRIKDKYTIKKLLNDNRYLIYQIDAIGKTPLHRACKSDSKEIVELLLGYYPDINKHDKNGLTPLSEAILNDNLEIVRNLLVNKAKPWFDGNGSYKNICKSGAMCSLIEKAKYFWLSLIIQPLGKKDEEWSKRIKFAL